MIACGHCGGSHATVAEVRSCHGGRSSRPGEPTLFEAAAPAEDGPPEPEGPPPDPWLDDEPPPAPDPRTTRPAPVPVVRPTRGTHVVVADGQPPPDGWRDAPRVRLDDDVLADPGPTVAELQVRWSAREPTAIELAADLDAPPDERFDGEVWRLAPEFDFPLERLHHLVWSDSVDGRDGSPAPRSDDGPPVDGGPLRPDDTVPLVNAEHGSHRPLTRVTSSAELAPDQLEAVHHEGGPARIIAPAGSGKTRALTERARLLLDGWGLTPAALCLVAFNTRAADEMRERTTDLRGLRVRTLNSLGLAVVAGTGEFAGTSDRRRPAVLDEPAVRRLIGDLVELPRRANTDPVAPWLEALTQVRLGLRSPESVEAEYQGDIDGFADFFERYRAALAERGALDFDEQIYQAIEVLCRDPERRHRAQRACRVLLVDEFQDLTPAHLLLLRLLSAPRYDVYGVGDDDQTIYGYNGADPAWLINYADYFPGAAGHALEVNYRCPPTVVDKVATLLTHNRRRVDKTIRAAPGRTDTSGSLAVVRTDDPTAEVVEGVQALLADGAAPHDIAVLARVNASLAPVQVALGAAAVPRTAPIGPEFLQRTGVRAALAWLRIGADPSHLRAADIRETARRPSHGISPRVIDWMTEHDTLDAVRRLAGRLGERDADKIGRWLQHVETLAQPRAADDTDDLLRRIRDDVGLARATDTLDRSRRKVDRSSHGDDLDALEQLGRLEPDAGRFSDWLHDRLEGPGDRDGVRLSTIHRVKGREWPHVLVFAANDGLLPHRLSDDVEEERRVFHVAVTRARTTAAVLADAGRPSRFLRELDEAAPPVEVTDAAEATGGEPAGPTLPVAPGLEFDHGGYTVEVTAISDEGVTVTMGRATTSVAYGTEVRHDGRRLALAPPAAPLPTERRAPGRGAPAPELTADQADLRERLRAWRKDRAVADGVPAFVVFNDKTLDELVSRRPTDEAELLACKGIGPHKVETYGDELLGVVAGG